MTDLGEGNKKYQGTASNEEKSLPVLGFPQAKKHVSEWRKTAVCVKGYCKPWAGKTDSCMHVMHVHKWTYRRRLTGTSYNYLKSNQDISGINNTKSWSMRRDNCISHSAAEYLHWALLSLKSYLGIRAQAEQLEDLYLILDMRGGIQDIALNCSVLQLPCLLSGTFQSQGSTRDIWVQCTEQVKFLTDYLKHEARILQVVKQELFKLHRLSQWSWKSHSYLGIKTVSSNAILQQCLFFLVNE